MFEDKTFENLMSTKLQKVPTDVDKREGSIVYDAMAPNAWESALIYQEIAAMYKEMFGSTASRPYLILRAQERGLTPKPASQGVYLGEFNTKIPIGTRFSLNDFNYITLAEIGLNTSENYYEYQMQCESVGIEPNSNFGTLIPIGYFAPGLTHAQLTETLIPGEDEEDTEVFRKRYHDSFDVQAYGGNIKDYEEKVMAIAGVGAVKVEPVWQGGGTVLLTILDSQFNAATPILIDSVQAAVDPTQDHTGKGIEPIGHVVTVNTAVVKNIYVACTLILNGIDLENIKDQIDEIINNYLLELRKQWADSEKLIVRINQIETRILNLNPKIIDILDTKINGAESNYEIATNEIPIWAGGNYAVG